jgi:hypothetical protein
LTGPSHLGLVLERSLMVGLVGLVPLPFVDSWIGGRVLRVLLADLGRRHQLTMEPACVRALAAAAQAQSPLASTSMVLPLFRLTAPLALVRRADEALNLFAAGALWDHYLEQHHPGRPIAALATDRKQARVLGALIARATGIARKETLPRLFSANVRGLYVGALIDAFDALYPERDVPR